MDLLFSSLQKVWNKISHSSYLIFMNDCQTKSNHEMYWWIKLRQTQGRFTAQQKCVEMCRNMMIFILLKSKFTFNIVHDFKIQQCVNEILEYLVFTNLLLHQILKIEDDLDVVASFRCFLEHLYSRSFTWIRNISCNQEKSFKLCCYESTLGIMILGRTVNIKGTVNACFST